MSAEIALYPQEPRHARVCERAHFAGATRVRGICGSGRSDRAVGGLDRFGGECEAELRRLELGNEGNSMTATATELLLPRSRAMYSTFYTRDGQALFPEFKISTRKTRASAISVEMPGCSTIARSEGRPKKNVACNYHNNSFEI